MADRVLRDQCEHGRYDEHRVSVGWDVEPCPGGREVTIDYEAAAEALEVWAKADQLADKAGRWAATVEAVDAALPDGEV